MYYFKPQEKPRKWGSFQDVQYAVRVNAEKIYGVDSDSMVLCIPLFWGLPPLDYSGKNNNGTNYGAIYKNGGLAFDGGNEYVVVNDNISLDILNLTITFHFKPHTNLDNSLGINKGLINKDIDVAWGVWYRSSFQDIRYRIYVGSTQYNLDYPSTYFAEQQYSMAVTYDGETQLIFLAGLEVANSGVPSGNLAITTSNVYISASCYRSVLIPNQFFNGTIDDVNIFNIAQTIDQISLFHDRPWDLYRPIARPFYSIPTTPTIFTPRIIMF